MNELAQVMKDLSSLVIDQVIINLLNYIINSAKSLCLVNKCDASIFKTGYNS